MKIFLSSTYSDLVDYREHVRDALLLFGETYRGMEYFGASASSTLSYCLDQLKRCQLVVCILGTRYGDKPPSSDKSFTHLEIEHALANKIPILAFFLDEENQPVLRRHIDHGEDAEKLSQLKTQLSQRVKPIEFTTPHDLAKKVLASLAERAQSSEFSLSEEDADERVASRFRETAYDAIAEWYDYWYHGHWVYEQPYRTICSIARSYFEATRGNISNFKILDCACGTGNTFVAFTNAGFEIFGTDGSKQMLKRAVANCRSANVSTERLITEPINWTDSDAYSSRFADGYFDLIVNTANSFCHIPATAEYMQRALANFHRLLKPGGLLMIDTKRYVSTGTPAAPTFMELQYDPEEKNWVIRSEREERQTFPGWGEIRFHTRLLYDVDPSFGENVSRALIVITIYGKNFSPKTLVVPYYPLPAKKLMDQMVMAKFNPTLFPARKDLASDWKYDIVVGRKLV